MIETAIWIISRALRISTVGVSLGALVVASSFVVSMPQVATIAGVVQWVVILLVPVLTWVVARNDLLGPDAAAYSSTGVTIARLLAVALLGTLIANGIYYTLILQAPVGLRGYNLAEWRALLDQQIDILRYLLALIVATSGAIRVASWAVQQSKI